MRTKLLFIWLALAICLFCIHYGPGQKWLQYDRAAKLSVEAKEFEDAGDWLSARTHYESALEALPEEGAERHRMILEMSRAWTYLNTSDIAEATNQLNALLEKAREQSATSEVLMRDLRGALAHAHYYKAWHMRLENADREQWLKELEHARQNYRYLAETSTDTSSLRNLEATVLLARMDLEDLEGLPLPEEDSGNGSQNVAGEGEEGEPAPGESPGQQEGEPDDAREQGLGNRPEGIGS